jgi:hypothetical protein
MTARGKKSVDLGYFNGDYPAWDLEADYEAWELSSRHFPSKVGGRPAWLDLSNLPASSVIKVGGSVGITSIDTDPVQCWGSDSQDSHVFCPSGSISQRYGSGSFPFLMKVLRGLKKCLQN